MRSVGYGGGTIKCLRCGYCCKHLWVVILKDGNKPPTDNNLEAHLGHGEPCRHLKGKTPGKYRCAIHSGKHYRGCPCDRHKQVERDPKDVCRMGRHVLGRTRA